MPPTDAPQSARYAALARALRGPHVVCGYGRASRNPRDRSQPLVHVVFRRLSPDGSAPSFARPPVPLTLLGQYRCGDVVDDGRVVDRPRFDRECFEVDFSPSGWSFQSARCLPHFPSGHWLDGYVPSGAMVVFSLDSDRTLWVPCLELLSRTYGASQEIKRVLATYTWAEVQDRLLPSPGQPTTPDRPVLKIPHHLVRDDAYFLARLRHSCYTRCAAREIYSQFDVAFPSKAAEGILLQVCPWFEGPARLLVEGDWLSDVFLVHRIVGGSLPRDPAPRVIQEHAADADADTEGASLEPAPPVSPRHPVPALVELTADRPPGRGTGHVDLRDDAFVVVGPHPDVIIESVSRAPRERPGPSGNVSPPAHYSTGDPTGFDPATGDARIHAPPSDASDGFFLAVWNAFRALRASTPRFDSLHWYTFGAGFRSSDPPEVLSFQPSKAHPRSRWAWLDHKARPPRCPRGLLVLRCVLAGRPGYVVEIERRPAQPEQKHPERRSGLVFVLRAEHDLDDWLDHLLSCLPDTSGRYRPCVGPCPGRVDTFKHPDATELTHSQAGARNALSKLQDFLRSQA